MPRLGGMLIRLVTSVIGGIVAFAVWLIALLVRMPRPPVPPSYVATLTAAVVVAAGLAIGMLMGERLTKCRPTELRGTYAWSLAGCAAGATIMFPFGGMMAGFGLLGLGMATVVARELRR